MSTQAAAHVEVLVGTQEQLHELLSHAEATLFPAASGGRSAGRRVTPPTPPPHPHPHCDTVPPAFWSPGTVPAATPSPFATQFPSARPASTHGTDGR